MILLAGIEMKRDMVLRNVTSIVILILCPTLVFAELVKVKIVEIVDCNLFRTNDGAMIKLANIESPSISGNDSIKPSIKRKILKYAKTNMINFRLYMEIVDSTQEIYKAHLFRKDGLSMLSFNEQYLKMGYGAYIEYPISTYSNRYAECADAAIKKRIGIYDDRPEDYSITRNSIWGRFRFAGGCFAYAEDENETSLFPIIGPNYRISKLFTIKKSNQSYLNMSCEIGSNLIVMNYLKFGPELGKTDVYFMSFNYCYLILPFENFFDLYALPFWNLSIGVNVPKTTIEIEVGYWKSLNNETTGLIETKLIFNLR